ncbi:DinB family protein, partial [Tamlana crocina]
FRAHAVEDLNLRTHPGSWSVLECIEHLNFYGYFYLPEMEKQIAASPYPAVEIFKSGLLGNYFAESMLPKEKLNKMKTLKNQDPIGKVLNREVLDVFVDQQLHLLNIIERAKQVDLCRTKPGISITKYLRLRLRDTMRVVIYHNQ